MHIDQISKKIIKNHYLYHEIQSPIKIYATKQLHTKVDMYREELENIKKILTTKPRGMSVTDISKELGISRNTVAKYLEILRYPFSNNIIIV